MANKDFKVKNKLVIAGLTNAAGVILAENNTIDSHTNLATQYGGTGTTTSPSAGQVLYSSSGTTYAPTTLSSLIQGSNYQADAPSSPDIGDIWIESDSSSDTFDPNIIRRKSFTATGGQTAFVTDVNFVDGYEQVYFNGLLLLRTTDYTTSGNNTITLGVAAAVNDIIEVVTITNLNSQNTYTQAEINSAILTAVPSQTGHTGKYLTTNGSATSWGTVAGDIESVTAGTGLTGGGTSGAVTVSLDTTSQYVIPSQTGESGKYLTTNGSATSWGTVSQYSLPSQSGNNGKFLTTNGTSESWESVDTQSIELMILMGAYL